MMYRRSALNVFREATAHAFMMITKESASTPAENLHRPYGWREKPAEKCSAFLDHERRQCDGGVRLFFGGVFFWEAVPLLPPFTAKGDTCKTMTQTFLTQLPCASALPKIVTGIYPSRSLHLQALQQLSHRRRCHSCSSSPPCTAYDFGRAG